jgi:hypothetical protein
MPQLAEDAIKLAILNHPQTFGLTQAEVNPMLMFVQHCIEHGDEKGPVELWKLCFEVVNTTLHQKVVEVFTGLSVVQSKAQASAVSLVEPELQSESEPEPEPQPDKGPAPSRKNGNGKAAGNGSVIGSPARELSTKQLRYLGYLTRQAGEEPDYTVISKLSQKEATLRIKALEANVKNEAAAR